MIARSVRVTLIAAVGICLALPVLAQHTFSSGETRYNRHVASLFAPVTGAKPEAHARALSDLAGELWLAAASAVSSVEACRSESGADAMAAARCVNERAVAVLTPEALSTEIEPYCAYRTHPDKRPEAVAACFLRNWRDISSRSLSMHAQIERSSACSYPDLVRLRALHANRTERYVEQVIALDALLYEETGRNKQRAPYATLRPDRALEQLNRAQTRLAEAQERAREFKKKLAADSPPIEVGTLIVISTAQQRFAWCLNRHPDRARQWEETFAAYKEGSPASSLAWGNPVPTVPNAQPIDVRGAARRTFEAMVTAHQPGLPNIETVSPPIETGPATPDSAYEKCEAIRQQALGQQELLAQQAARLAILTSSEWDGCRATFFSGAAAGIHPDASFGASTYASRKVERIVQKSGAPIPKTSPVNWSIIGAQGLGYGFLASSDCRAQKERPVENPVAATPNLDGRGENLSTILPEMPAQVSIPQMQELIMETSERISQARNHLENHCLTGR
ncbi:hypothetical protein [Roseovarius sp.]|uniref:hypothetical protein n=1 Tax=Roseovarius sp. TaxID=1486281 RepID=UPI0035695260